MRSRKNNGPGVKRHSFIRSFIHRLPSTSHVPDTAQQCSAVLSPSWFESGFCAITAERVLGNISPYPGIKLAAMDCKRRRRWVRAWRCQGDHPHCFISIAPALAQADCASHPSHHGSLLTCLPEPTLTSMDAFRGPSVSTAVRGFERPPEVQIGSHCSPDSTFLPAISWTQTNVQTPRQGS